MEHCQECKRTADHLFKCGLPTCPVEGERHPDKHSEQIERLYQIGAYTALRDYAMKLVAPSHVAAPTTERMLLDEIDEVLDELGAQREIVNGDGLTLSRVGRIKSLVRSAIAPSLSAVLDEYDLRTTAIPAGTENAALGCSAYNWRRAIVHELRSLAEAMRRADGTAKP